MPADRVVPTGQSRIQSPAASLPQRRVRIPADTALNTRAHWAAFGRVSSGRRESDASSCSSSAAFLKQKSRLRRAHRDSRAALTGVEVFVQAELDERPDAFGARLEVDGDVDDAMQLVQLLGHAAVEVAKQGAVP